jgi:FtsH-binding integral membrane protein
MSNFTKTSTACLAALTALRDGFVVTALAQERLPLPYRPGPNVGGSAGGGETFAALVVVVALGIFILMMTMLIADKKDSASIGRIGLAAAVGVPIAAFVWFQPAIEAFATSVGFFGVAALVAGALYLPRLLAEFLDRP